MKQQNQCSVPGCKFYICMWGSVDKCYPHEEELVGNKEMVRRYNLTHRDPMNSRGFNNPMIKTFEEIKDETSDADDI